MKLLEGLVFLVLLPVLLDNVGSPPVAIIKETDRGSHGYNIRHEGSGGVHLEQLVDGIRGVGLGSESCKHNDAHNNVERADFVLWRGGNKDVKMLG